MFPFDTDDLEDKEILDDIDSLSIPKEFEIDFETGQLTGRIVEGLDAIKTWAYLTLHTSRYRYLIYSWDYGNELEDLIGQSYTDDYIETEVVRMIEECLLVNGNIESVDNFNIGVNEDKLNINFTINTIYGEVDISV